ncbi:MAG: antibiotic ABC transporter ATP-binding protein [Bacteroidetes bacterium 4572_112]|nr:MAG: antibiotic ABC transporter ATP-binding protein [Bacteroidetes bacterium 4572_112]
MKDFLRLLSLVKGYKSSVIMNITFNITTIFFSIFSIGMIIPFLKLIFGMDTLKTDVVEFAFNKDSMLDYMYYMMSSSIAEYGTETVLFYISTITAISFLLKNLFRYLAMWSIAPLRNGVLRDLRNAIFQKIIILPLSYFSEKKKGDIISRATNDVQDIEWTIIGTLEIIFQHTITLIVFIVVLLMTNYQLTLMMFLVMPISIIIIGLLGKVLRKESLIAQTLMGSILSLLDEGLSGLRIIKGFNAQKVVVDRFEETNNKYMRTATTVMRRGDLSAPISEFFGMLVVSLILWYGGKLVLDPSKSLTGEEFIFFILLFSQMIPSIKALSTGYQRIQKGIASAERIYGFLDADEKIFESKDAIVKSDFEKEISFNNVGFKYEEEQVLKNINLKIPKGKMIALVGSSGAGKTTMADLLPRFYDVIDGNISIDGTDIREIKINDLRGLMGIVTQEAVLFHDSIRGNIKFGSELKSDEEMIEAAKAANAHNFIMQMPAGYDTVIGDRGDKLSGGQRQRVTIARAILKNPPILILDEATSALDTESEKLVQDALQKLMANRTSVVIAHRLSTIHNADQIVVMDKGEIVQQGLHSELIEQDGIYKRLNLLQKTS